MRIDLLRRGLLAATSAVAVGPFILPRRARAAGDDIVVGQIGPFTGTPVPGAAEIRQGLQAALAQANAAGGLRGRRIALFELDDGFSEDGFVRRFAEALKRRPVALLSPLGTSAVQRLLDDRLLDAADVVVLNAVPGAESLRSPGHPRLFHIRAGDRQQVERIIRHAGTVGVTGMAVVYQDVSIGTTGLAVAEQVAGELGMRLFALRVPADGAGLAEVAARAAAGAAQSALVLGSPRFGAECIVALRKAGLHHALYALSYVSPALIRQLDAGAARGVALAQVYPNPNGNRMALQGQFQAAMQRHGAAGPYSAFQMEGYITARVLAEGLRRATDLSPAGLARALRAMGDVDLGGYRVNFTRDNLGSSFVDIAVINGAGRLVY